jgi:hypothetical protein
MKPSHPSPAPLPFCLALLFLAGCATTEPTAAIRVSSPPPPRVGSAPIAAYDDYARAVAPPLKARIEAVAQAGTP